MAPKKYKLEIKIFADVSVEDKKDIGELVESLPIRGSGLGSLKGSISISDDKPQVIKIVEKG